MQTVYERPLRAEALRRFGVAQGDLLESDDLNGWYRDAMAITASTDGKESSTVGIDTTRIQVRSDAAQPARPLLDEKTQDFLRRRFGAATLSHLTLPSLVTALEWARAEMGKAASLPKGNAIRDEAERAVRSARDALFMLALKLTPVRSPEPKFPAVPGASDGGSGFGAGLTPSYVFFGRPRFPILNAIGRAIGGVGRAIGGAARLAGRAATLPFRIGANIANRRAFLRANTALGRLPRIFEGGTPLRNILFRRMALRQARLGGFVPGIFSRLRF